MSAVLSPTLTRTPQDVIDLGITEEIVEHWRNHPDLCVEDVFDVKPDDWQREALQGIAEYEARITVRACHGPGKSALDTWAIMTFMLCYFPCRVPCTAPTSHQLDDILWAEIAKWMRHMDPKLQGLFRLTKERLEWTAAPRESFAVARTARPEKPEALQGFHSDNMLFILDEASGIDEKIFEVAQGSLSTAGSKILMTANPTRVSGYFYESHTKMKRFWKTFKVSHEDSPRVTDKYVEYIAAKYGIDSNVYRVRCLGEFPTAGDDVLVPFDAVEAARGREIKPIGDTVWGLDVARFGDDRNALCKSRQNAIIEPFQWWSGMDLMVTTGKVSKEYNKTPIHERPIAIYVDVIGLGAGVVDRLQELDIPAIGVNVSESASSQDEFMRLRDELYWSAREFFTDKDCTIPEGTQDVDDVMEIFVSEITTPTYKEHSSGKIEVEKKKDLKRRGVRSPDIAESFILTRYHVFTFRTTLNSQTKANSYSREQRKREIEAEDIEDDGIV